MGFVALPTARRSFVELLGIDRAFLVTSLPASPPLSDRTDSLHEMSQWVAAIPADEARHYLLLLLQGKAKQAEREVRQKYMLAGRAQVSPATVIAEQKRRTLAELHILVERARAE